MMRITSRILLLITLLTFNATAWAQFMEPVKFTVHQEKVGDNELELTFNGKIDAGWHLYGTDIPGDGPTRAELTLEKSQGVKAKGKLVGKGNLHRQMDDMFGMELSFYENSVTFVQRFVITEPTYSLSGYLTYGACNDENCIPPTNVDFSYSGTGVTKAAADNKKADEKKADAAKAADKNAADAASTKATETKDADASAANQNADLQATADKDETSSDNTDNQTSTDVETAESDSADSSTTVDEQPTSDTQQATSDTQASSTSTSAEQVAKSGLIAIFFMGFVAGILALLTPCVWPIIPMTVSFFLKRSKDDKKKGVHDAVRYGISIVFIYLMLGLIVTICFGASALNDLSTNAFFNIFFFLMLLTFGASFLGGFEITLPSSWSNAIDKKSEATTGRLSIFLMAFTLVLVSFSCTGPIIGFLLVEVGTNGADKMGPVIGMLGFAIALALPFSLFAMFPTWLKSTPKSGNWMNCIKVCLGLLEIAFSLKFLSVADLAYGWHILDREVFLSLWIVIFALAGAYLIGWIRFPHDEDEYDEMGEVIVNHRTSITRFFMALCAFAFALYMVPGLWGAPCKAVSAFAPPMSTQDFNISAGTTTTTNAESGSAAQPHFEDYDEGMAYAKEHHMPVMIDFTGYGCVNCRKMEASVFTDSKVQELMTQKYVVITLYVDEKKKLQEPETVTENGSERKLRTVGDKWSYLQRSRFGANAQPFYVLLDNDGNQMGDSRSYDEDVPAFTQWLESGLQAYGK